MPVFSDKDKTEIQKILSPMEGSVTLHYFTQEFECLTCKAGHDLCTELAGLSDKLTLRVHDFVKDKAAAAAMGVDKIPALTLEGARPNKIHFYGIPAGYEFSTLLEDLLDVSKGASDLHPDTLEALAKLKKPVHLQVFVTPT